MTKLVSLLVIITFSSPIFGQKKALTFSEAKLQGISIEYLDSIYKSAVHADTTKAVFKTEKEQDALQQAYIKLLQDFGNFLSKNNFKWEKPTKCYNRIYFNSDGSIDYFIFNFLGKTEVKPAESVQIEFQRLLTIFIQEYRFSLTSKTKFAQCSPTTYMPEN